MASPFTTQCMTLTIAVSFSLFATVHAIADENKQLELHQLTAEPATNGLFGDNTEFGIGLDNSGFTIDSLLGQEEQADAHELSDDNHPNTLTH